MAAEIHTRHYTKNTFVKSSLTQLSRSLRLVPAERIEVPPATGRVEPMQCRAVERIQDAFGDRLSKRSRST